MAAVLSSSTTRAAAAPPTHHLVQVPRPTPLRRPALAQPNRPPVVTVVSLVMTSRTLRRSPTMTGGAMVPLRTARPLASRTTVALLLLEKVLASSTVRLSRTTSRSHLVAPSSSTTQTVDLRHLFLQLQPLHPLPRTPLARPQWSRLSLPPPQLQLSLLSAPPLSLQARSRPRSSPQL